MRDLLGIPRAPLTFHTGSKVKPPMRGPGEHFVFLAPFLPTFLVRVLRQTEAWMHLWVVELILLTKARASRLAGNPKHCPRGGERGNNRPTRAPTREQWRTSHAPAAPRHHRLEGVTGQVLSSGPAASPAPRECPRGRPGDFCSANPEEGRDTKATYPDHHRLVAFEFGDEFVPAEDLRFIEGPEPAHHFDAAFGWIRHLGTLQKGTREWVGGRAGQRHR